MRFLKHSPLQKKLTWLAMACSVVALTTTAVTLGAYEWYFYRKVILSQLLTLTSITARNCSAALAFANADDGSRILSSLQTEPSIRAAGLYDSGGKRFAVYSAGRRSGLLPETVPPDGVRAHVGGFTLVVPVVETQRYGTLVVEADVRALRERITGYAVALLTTTTLSGFLAFILASQLKRRITSPVLALVAAASGVQTNADYSVRVAKEENDELGALTEAFNGMLERIQQNQFDLNRSEERLRLALDAAQIGTWDWDIAHGAVRWDERNREIFRAEPSEPVTESVFWNRIHRDDVAKVRAALDKAFVSGEFATEFRLDAGEAFSRFLIVRGVVLRDANHKPHRAVGVTIDVTERRRAEQRVLENEQRFRAVAEKAPALIWSCDAEFKRDYFNRTWLSFTGRSLEQELGHAWRASLFPADEASWNSEIAAAAAQGDPYSVEYRLRRADGVFRWVIETASPRLSAKGSFAGYLGTCIDITSRKENEAELEAHVRLRTRQLELANQELESFSYSVSHDLRSPVRVIQGFAEIALEEATAGNISGLVEPLRRISRGAKRMDDLINAFIMLARISRADLRFGNVDLSKVAQEVVASLRALYPERSVDVAIEPGLSGWGDERLLRIALDNLFGNAWKFTAGQTPAVIQFGRQETEGETAFALRDNGAGFNQAFAAKLFQVFQRLHAPSQFEGLGVGLNTVSRVIQRHNGRIWAEGREGVGACFFFTLGTPELTEQ